MSNQTETAFETPRHWVGVDELNPSYWADEKIQERRGQEFYDKPVETIDLITKLDTKGIARRDFLTIMGASMAMASFACARRPVHKIIPYVVKPEEVTEGVANYYATTCPETGYGILAKVREGRPIKLEGNPDHAISRGFLSARMQAAVLDLYDMDRAKEPKKISRGKTSAALKWEDADAEVASKLKAIAAGSGRIRLVSNKVLSDTTQRLINEFLAGFGSSAHIQLDCASNTDVAAGQLESYGSAVLPYYRFDQAEVVLSLGADFLGSSEEYTADWSKTRKPSEKNPTMSKLIVAESMLSVTGANADERMPVRPDGVLKIGAAIALEVARKRGVSVPASIASYTLDSVSKDTGIPAAKIQEAAQALLSAGNGNSLVVAGGLSSMTADSKALQVVANFLNSTLGNDGKTVDGNGQAMTKVGSNAAQVSKLISDMNSGAVDALIVWGANPAYALPSSMGFKEAVAKVPYVISISDREDETAKLSDVLLPDHHFLENWGDSQPRSGVVSLQQPTLAPIASTRAFQDTLLAWVKGGVPARGLAAATAKSEDKNTWHDYLKANWKETYAKGSNFESFWENSLRDGVLKVSAKGASSRSFRAASLSLVPSFSPKKEGMVLALYSKTGIGDGTHANNPWLQELPDPITSATWDNYLNLGPKTAEKLGLIQNDVVDVVMGSTSVSLPVNVLPGLHSDIATAAIGYGREAVGKVGNGVGKDVKVFVGSDGAFSGQSISIKKTGRRYQIALTQLHNLTENRPIINDITLDEFKKNPKLSNHTDPHLRMDEVPSLWPKHKYPGYRWGMSIDLTSCTGCGSCIIACQAENNIPVVGRDNVRKSREMHWIRIDRYFAGSPENPDVVFQPMLCQHCENAPCETVCPVLATVHDNEGLNSQVYNRCVGTRYCQNNCPYKVRRFNFFDHWKSYEGTMNLAWNPDVTVRTRGIMEKCTFCVQRIRDVKDKAKDEGRTLRDGEIKTACQQTCPTDAIVFGDINNKDTEVSKLKVDSRAFRALEVLNALPVVSYLTKVRNKAVGADHSGHGSAHGNAHGEAKGGHHE